ncbi:unnamed protein product [Microthlaspi erraticum]|uniref:MADS-box domain-containing protein n=1 Tax=Microthlaspi erraticum TaxID=1685480 RepID=A0A6D2IKU6_9BRAS|nr:unnamed protein product [Microthlaspi erraticum]
MGGKKRAIKIEQIEKKTVKSVAFTKRRDGLFRKASELCRLSPETQIAILATPPSSNSHASFYSLGHPSAEHVVSYLLNEQSPFWWEDERFERSENVDELREAVDAVTRMRNNAGLRLDAVRSDQRDKGKGIQQEEEGFDQLCNTMTNNNEEITTKQITTFEGASGSGLLEIEDGGVDIDDFLAIDF